MNKHFFKMTLPTLFLCIAAVEGFVSISIEMLLLRQLLPFVGSSVVTTSIIIGVFLLFLAYGYRKGGQIYHRVPQRLTINFGISAFLLGIGLSYVWVHTWFSVLLKAEYIAPQWGLLTYLLCVAAPLIYLLGQTIPMTLRWIEENTRSDNTVMLAGRLLHLNTLGSFLGAVVTSVLLFSWLGVAWTLWVATFLLVALSLILMFVFKQPYRLIYAAVLMALGVMVYVLNVQFENNYFIRTNDYANYRVSTRLNPPEWSVQFEINRAPSSQRNSAGKGFPYIEKMKTILFDELKLRNQAILILGAGVFTLSEQPFENRFVYVDIDPSIEEIAKEHFSGTIKGEFVAQDARVFVKNTHEQFDAVVIDAYNTPLAMPSHLLTQEFFTEVTRVLKPGGVILVNAIGSSRFSDAYTRRLDNTLRTGLGPCTAEPLNRAAELTNTVYVCYPMPKDLQVYRDDKNTATWDGFQMSIKLKNHSRGR